jgi:hypothetical protein
VNINLANTNNTNHTSVMTAGDMNVDGRRYSYKLYLFVAIGETAIGDVGENIVQRSNDSLDILIKEAEELRSKLDAERCKLHDVPS